MPLKDLAGQLLELGYEVIAKLTQKEVPTGTRHRLSRSNQTSSLTMIDALIPTVT